MPSSSRTPKAKATATKPKPYDRPASAAAAKGKGKAVAAPVPPVAETNAPAQHGQSSRKGKKAWRKNIDTRPEEEALERVREEERATGGRVAEKSDGALFTIDTTGDVQVAKKMRVKKPLRSLAVLSERSAVPSFTARAAPPKAVKAAVSNKDKNRLRQIARKTVDGESSADVRKTDTSTLRDAWGAEAAPRAVPGGFAEETLIKRKVKAPETLRKQRKIRLQAIANQIADELPTAGVSYNPAADAHAELMGSALTEEAQRIAKEKAEAEEVSVLGNVIEGRRENAHFNTDEFAEGMRVGRGDGEDETSDEESDSAAVPKKPTVRKTQAQRNKALRARANRQAAKDDLVRRKLEKGISAAKALGKAQELKARASEEAARLRKLAATQRERLGFSGGEKVGKHRVAKAAVTVQLGEDLAESLRQLKPEGNLFKDRFLSLQRRALLEPRVPQLPKTRKVKTKEYEKHAWKRFK